MSASQTTLSSLLGSLGLSSNPYFTAGIGLGGLGIGVALARRFQKVGAQLIRNHFFTTLEITSKDRSFHYVMNWLNSRHRNRFSNVAVETTVVQLDDGQFTTRSTYTPGQGMHFFFHKNRVIRLDRERSANVVDISTGIPWETLKFTTFGRNSSHARNFFHDMIEEATSEGMKRDQVPVYCLKIMKRKGAHSYLYCFWNSMGTIWISKKEVRGFYLYL